MIGVLRPAVRQLTHSAVFARFVGLLERFDGGSPHLLRVLTYHRIAEPDARPDLYPNTLSATPDQFERQMSFLAGRYRVLSMPELEAAWDHDSCLPPRSVLLTFDDAYRDFGQIAWPVMKRLGLPVTLFVPTAFPDQPQRAFWWDRLHQAVHASLRRDSLDTPIGRLPLETADERTAAVRRLTAHVKALPHRGALAAVERLCVELNAPAAQNEVLSWNELRELARQGVTLGAHTRTHPLLNRLSLDEARAEALGSREDLEREVGPQPAVLAYPAGGCHQEIARMLQREGFRFAFTTHRGLNDVRTADRMLLRRINVGRGTSDAALRGQLLPWMKYAGPRSS